MFAHYPDGEVTLIAGTATIKATSGGPSSQEAD